ncbi:B3 domain-containing protein At2g33720-like [Gastrolobium bilobum]|uniref:B3 domain-containing protein At2g33720-like n=1 Tax=Gastrolobium bilobum TaxID=150636 RepID=UPI002AB01013|nr:B3 domain-containing protein At2g33720-like [Gastrolobium bilobum]
MHHELTGSYNIPQGKKGHDESSAMISTELSLSPSSFQSKKRKHIGGASRTQCSSASKRNRKKTSSACCNNNNERQYNWGCSTSLELYDNPWKIKKALTSSDLGKLNRLLFGEDLLENLMVPVLGVDAQREAENGMGTPIRVWDVDTMSMHHLILKRWASFKNYVLIGKWNPDFVKRRELKKGDEIGFQWDSYKHCFNFSVLNRTQ